MCEAVQFMFLYECRTQKRLKRSWKSYSNTFINNQSDIRSYIVRNFPSLTVTGLQIYDILLQK